GQPAGRAAGWSLLRGRPTAGPGVECRLGRGDVPRRAGLVRRAPRSLRRAALRARRARVGLPGESATAAGERGERDRTEPPHRTAPPRVPGAAREPERAPGAPLARPGPL